MVKLKLPLLLCCASVVLNSAAAHLLLGKPVARVVQAKAVGKSGAVANNLLGKKQSPSKPVDENFGVQPDSSKYAHNSAHNHTKPSGANLVGGHAQKSGGSEQATSWQSHGAKNSRKANRDWKSKSRATGNSARSSQNWQTHQHQGAEISRKSNQGSQSKSQATVNSAKSNQNWQSHQLQGAETSRKSNQKSQVNSPKSNEKLQAHTKSKSSEEADLLKRATSSQGAEDTKAKSIDSELKVTGHVGKKGVSVSKKAKRAVQSEQTDAQADQSEQNKENRQAVPFPEVNDQ